jgi:threonine dehydratase
MLIDYNNRVFRSVATSPAGDVDSETRFLYRHEGNIVWATYEGGGIRFGTLTALVRPNGSLDMRYQQISSGGFIKTGRCMSRPEVLPDGRVCLHEEWRWTEGGEGEGRSRVEEIRPPAEGLQGHRLSVERIVQAAAVIDAVFLNSPQFRAESLEPHLGCRLVVKVETLNPIRSFKGRGAEYLTATLAGRPHLVCATAGNFGQGMAYAARKRGLSLTIFTSANANPMKVARMRAFGADVRPIGADHDDAHRAASVFAEETGAQLVEDGRDRAIAEGAGTIGLELLRWSEPFDVVLVPVGDGALLAGLSRWVKAHHPSTRMIGVLASGAPAMERSWRSGRVQQLDRADTIADGIAVRVPFAEALADITGLVDDMLLVDDQQLLAAMRLTHRELGVVLEPSGAAGLAALLTYRDRFRGQLAATILTGGNITPEQMQRWLGVSA